MTSFLINDMTKIMRASIGTVIIAFCLFSCPLQTAEAQVPEQQSLARKWIEEMKSSPRGPFSGIRWFCKDGTVLPARQGCRGHGGGVQHGEWSEETKNLRESGFKIATVYASLDESEFRQILSRPHGLAPFLIERYLITSDDGWIYRQARDYRGAVQVEDEIEHSERLLFHLLSDKDRRDQYFFLLREAARLMPRAARTELISQIRALASKLARSNSRFTSLRNKIHAFPDAGDAESVRDFARSTGSGTRTTSYLALAELIDRAYSPADISNRLKGLIRYFPVSAQNEIKNSLERIETQRLAVSLYFEYAELLQLLREQFENIKWPGPALEILDASIYLEQSLYVVGRRLATQFPRVSRAGHLRWLEPGVKASYGVGLLSKREYYAARLALRNLTEEPPSEERYYNEVNYLTKVSEWAADRIAWSLGPAIEKFSQIEPLAELYVADRLRASPLLLVSQELEVLTKDAMTLRKIKHRFFGQDVWVGLQPLNPGLARGTLREQTSLGRSFIDPSSSIYIVPETIAELPPVAGLLTMRAGNTLSHVQLLARNLGIPNVVVSADLLSKLNKYEGRNVVVAASPGGRVEISEHFSKWNSVFAKESEKEDLRLVPDTEKLSLAARSFLSLDSLKAEDSGRIVGPKAAHLAELDDKFPGTVGPGVVVPFGVFEDFLKLRLAPDGKTLKEWITQEYTEIRTQKVSPAEREKRMKQFLKALRFRILSVRFNQAFLKKLQREVFKHVGPLGKYGVFVRSDTNVEDLPNFSGAGLNKTVPNVRTYPDLGKAILEVWASPFSWRAYSWRQAHMKDPTQVYVSVIIQRSMPVEKSGVLVTADLDSGEQGVLTIASNWGIGGVVSNQLAEVLTIDRDTGNVRLLSSATASHKKVLSKNGGLDNVLSKKTERVLSEDELVQLHRLSSQLPERFQKLLNSDGKPVPADVEFGFIDGNLVLFQIRPYLESLQARANLYLRKMDEKSSNTETKTVNLGKLPLLIERNR